MNLDAVITHLTSSYGCVVAPPRAAELDGIETGSGEIFLMHDPDRPGLYCWLVYAGVWSPDDHPPTSQIAMQFDPASLELRSYSLHSQSRSHWISTEQFPVDGSTTVEGLLSRLSEFRLAIERDRVTSPDGASAAFQEDWDVQAGSERYEDYE